MYFYTFRYWAKLRRDNSQLCKRELFYSVIGHKRFAQRQGEFYSEAQFKKVFFFVRKSI